MLTSACSMLDLAGGQLALINDQLPLSAAVTRETDPERAALLREVPAILAFAQDVVALTPGRSYHGYYATERKGLTFVVTACKRTHFEPYSWWFPIVGTVEYRSYWDEADAQDVARELEATGYDTFISPSRAYSSLGILRDPVTTTMLRDGLPGLVEVLIHELSHVKLFVPGHTDWNEALASFVGERGAERYFASARFAGSTLSETAKRRAQRRVIFDRLVDETYRALDALYQSGQTSAVLLQLRAAHFERLEAALHALYPEDPARDFHVNNARLLHFHRYTSSAGVLDRLWRESGQQFRGFWVLAERYAKTQL